MSTKDIYLEALASPKPTTTASSSSRRPTHVAACPLRPGNEVRFGFAMTVVGDEAAGSATAVNLSFDQLDFLARLGVLPGAAVAV